MLEPNRFLKDSYGSGSERGERFRIRFWLEAWVPVPGWGAGVSHRSLLKLPFSDNTSNLSSQPLRKPPLSQYHWKPFSPHLHLILVLLLYHSSHTKSTSPSIPTKMTTLDGLRYVLGDKIDTDWIISAEHLTSSPQARLPLESDCNLCDECSKWWGRHDRAGGDPIDQS